jgi:hypothetical protein
VHDDVAPGVQDDGTTLGQPVRRGQRARGRQRGVDHGWDARDVAIAGVGTSDVLSSRTVGWVGVLSWGTSQFCGSGQAGYQRLDDADARAFWEPLLDEAASRL